MKWFKSNYSVYISSFVLVQEASDSEMEYGSDEDGSGSDDDDVDASKEKKHPDRVYIIKIYIYSVITSLSPRDIN